MRAEGGVFINYRRGPHGHLVARLYERLQEHFGADRVFQDIPSLVPGARYPDALRERVEDCDVLLVVMHEGWAGDRTDTGARRLEQPGDWVRREIEQALRGGKTIVPVLLDAALPPLPDELPEPVRDLAHRQAQRLREARLEEDLAALVAVVEADVSRSWREIPAPEPRPGPGRVTEAVAAVAGALALVGLPVLLTDRHWAPATDDELPLPLWGVVWSCLAMGVPLVTVGLMQLLLRRGVDAVERELHKLRHETYVRLTWPMAAALAGAALAVVFAGRGGTGVEAALVMVLIVVLGLGQAVAHFFRTRQRERDQWENWPQGLPERVPRAALRRAVARLHRRVDGWRAPLSREQREKAAWELADLRAALTRLTGEARRSRRAWLRQDHPWLLGWYVLWLAGTLGLAVAAALTFDAAGRGIPRVFGALAATVLIGAGATAGTLELGHRRQRRMREDLVAEAAGHLAALDARVTRLAAPPRTPPRAPAPRTEAHAEPD
ncbi:hypothetical protein C3489_02060 [Streptomyces sp. Ru71]|uniref:toll/interleukin-1 receptor domain-containing protein n=1 Tax=Streptomyces sp. Ru71 TaxID=2080746 RepID=UPI000CDDF218|nr:toll/interleukin-1 receptor domain-containing protein [Streptomyces sp. Ru71]POX57056.1 hypothetical protein C3489_02060 [Streptomyces sp. Ru71]